MDKRIESLDVQEGRAARRDEQSRRFRRNQAIGLLLFALAIFAYRLIQAPAGSIFVHGWWRLW
jgi:hypothetical protein